MWVAGGVVQERVDALNHEITHGMLEVLGLVVYLIPGVTKRFHQEGFNESVATDHRYRVTVAGLCELDGSIGLVCNQALLPQLANRLRDGGFTQIKVLG